MSESSVVADANTVHAGLRCGQVVAGKYRIVRLLGRGGMGEVYEARHTVVGRRFAIKFLHAHATSGRDSGARFLREAQSAGALDNEHIAAVLDFDTTADGAPFLVMEYLSGESLAATLLREGTLPVPRVIGILLQVCDGLARAHEAGIVHRDLKPDNLFVVERPDGAELIKILDFGIAKLVGAAREENATHSGAVLGTPFYMAPEQARGEKSVDERVDIHALGVIAYELLSGQKPHPGDGYNAILAHILTQPVRPLAELRADVPSDLLRIIERAMAHEPAARPASVLSLARELSPLAGREVTAFAAQFDLRRPSDAQLGAATLPSGGVTRGPGDATQQGAVADVTGDATPNRKMVRARWPWAVLLGAALLLWFFSQSLRRTATPKAPDETASAALLADSSPPIESKPIASSAGAAMSASSTGVAASVSTAASPSSPAAPVSSQPASTVTPSLTLPAKKSSPATSKARSIVRGDEHAPSGGAPQVTFDDKNPY